MQSGGREGVAVSARVDAVTVRGRYANMGGKEKGLGLGRRSVRVWR